MAARQFGVAGPAHRADRRVEHPSLGSRSASDTSFRHCVGQTSTQPPHSTQRVPSNTGVTPQSRHREASRNACRVAVALLHDHVRMLQPLFRLARRDRHAADRLVAPLALVSLQRQMRRDGLAADRPAGQVAGRPSGPPLARSHRVDQQPRAVGQVARHEDARGRGGQRLRIDLRPARAELLDVLRRRRREKPDRAIGPRTAAPCRRGRSGASASSNTGAKRRFSSYTRRQRRNVTPRTAPAASRSISTGPQPLSRWMPSSSPSTISSVSAGISSSVSSETRCTRPVPGSRAAVRAVS